MSTGRSQPWTERSISKVIACVTTWLIIDELPLTSPLPSEKAETVRLEAWAGPWPDDDPDANFKQEIASYTRVDPLETVSRLAANIDVPVGAIVRYVLARWASAGSEALLYAGPSTIERMWDICRRAEQAGSPEARLAAFEELSSIVSWLRTPLE